MRPRIIDPAVKSWSVIHGGHVVLQHHSAVCVCGVVMHIGRFVHNIDPLYHSPVVYDYGALQISLVWSGANQHTMVGPNRFHSTSTAHGIVDLHVRGMYRTKRSIGAEGRFHSMSLERSHRSILSHVILPPTRPFNG